MTRGGHATSRLVASLALCLLVAGCAMRPPSAMGPLTWAGRPVGAAPAPDPGLRQSLISRATEEWEFFGRQIVTIKDGNESIPHVGAWEDDDGTHSSRVSAYWRAVGKSQLDGFDCQMPWSAAFISWLMQEAGIPESQFPPAIAHAIYLARLIEEAGSPGRFFIPRRVTDYSPVPGDLICASRGPYHALALDEDASPEALRGANTHCDLVVGKTGRRLDVIGGNVRNSVSKTTVELDFAGRLQPEPKRPWFLVLQNRL